MSAPDYLHFPQLRLTQHEYSYLLGNAVTLTCRKVTKDIEDIANEEDDIDRIENSDTSNYFVSLKNHKENY